MGVFERAGCPELEEAFRTIFAEKIPTPTVEFLEFDEEITDADYIRDTERDAEAR